MTNRLQSASSPYLLQHAENVLTAMQAEASALELDGSLASPPGPS